MQKRIIFLLLLVAGVLSLLTVCKKEPVRFDSMDDPIATIGHGTVLDKGGKEIKLDEPFIKKMQELYINNLQVDNLAVREGSVFDKEKTARIRKLVYDKVDNTILANAIFIDWLIEQRKPKEEAQFTTVNNALRWYYVLNIQENAILPNAKNEWWKGVTPEEGKDLEGGGVIVYAVVNSAMDAYCEECLEAGVPVPSTMFGPEWKNLGAFDNEFISGSRTPNLLIYISNDPEGFCLALPRYDAGSDRASLFGVICMGTRTSKVCFFDNRSGVLHRRDTVIPFRPSFIGGTDLVDNGGGTCTDCHAGENPYIVHPEKAPFVKVKDTLDEVNKPYWPRTWYDPLVAGVWPQNPGPTYLLDGITEGGQCNGCHMQGGSGGRFPDISYPLNGYCTDVLTKAVRPVASGGTMPPFGQDIARFARQIDALQRYCGAIIPFDPDFPPVIPGPIPPASPAFLSPPLLGTVYGCATRVEVRGLVLDAKASLFVEGEPIPLAIIDPARSPIHVDFELPRELRVGEVIYAVQEKDGATSAPSERITVRDYRVDFPDRLPVPEIDPTTVYTCASLIAVRHLQGAIITVVTNDDESTARSFTSGGSWTAIPPAGAPFTRGMKFKVKVSMCGDESPYSASVTVRDGPATLPTPVFRPPNIFTGQELLDIEGFDYGATVTLRNTALPAWTGTFSWPVTSLPDYDLKTSMGRPVQGGDNILARQKLCDTESEPTPPGSTKTQGCEGLPAPRIERPIAGFSFVVVADCVPGARIMVYDDANTEIGDGSGRIVMLSRAILPGERLRVVQRLGECTGRFVYQTRATRGN